MRVQGLHKLFQALGLQGAGRAGNKLVKGLEQFYLGSKCSFQGIDKLGTSPEAGSLFH